MISDFKIGKLYEVTATFYNYNNFGTCFQVGDFLVYLEEKESLTPGVIELIFLSPQHGRVFFSLRDHSTLFSLLREIPGDDE